MPPSCDSSTITVRDLAHIADPASRRGVAAHHGGELLASWSILWGPPVARAEAAPGQPSRSAGEPAAAEPTPASPGTFAGPAEDAPPPPPSLEGLGTPEAGASPTARRQRAGADRAAGRDVAWARRDPDVKVRKVAAKAERDRGRDLAWVRKDPNPHVRAIATRADERNAEALMSLGLQVRRDGAVHVFRRGDGPESVLTGDVMRSVIAEIQQKFGWTLPKGAFFAPRFLWSKAPRARGAPAPRRRAEPARATPAAPRAARPEPVVVVRSFPRASPAETPPARTSPVARDIASEFRSAGRIGRGRGRG